METCCKGSGGDSFVRKRGLNFAKNPRELSFKSASKKAMISATIDHDFRPIGPRSVVNNAARASSTACRSMGNDSAPIPRHLLLDRGSIAPRSWSSSTIFNRRPITLSLDERSRLSDSVRRDLPLMTIRRSSRRHVASCKRSDRSHLSDSLRTC